MTVGSRGWVLVAYVATSGVGCGDSGGTDTASGTDGSSTAADTGPPDTGASPTTSGDSSGDGGATGDGTTGTTATPTTTAPVDESTTGSTDTTDTTDTTAPPPDTTGETTTSDDTTTTSDDTTGAPDPFCGDGVLDDGEACDAGPDNADDAACTTACALATCGDGLVHAGVEACDDADADNSDDCTELCAAPACDDGLVSGSETDLDCGGQGCQGCGLGQQCDVHDDCGEGDCHGDACVVLTGCKQLAELEPAAPSDVYTIDPDGDGDGGLDVYCEMVHGGGGWTLVAYNFGVQGDFLKLNYHAVAVDTSPIPPTQGKQRAFDPVDVGIDYSELGFFTDDPQWSAPAREYRGFWIGDDPQSVYDLNSPLCQLLRPVDPEVQWDGELVYHGGDGANDNGCIGGGSIFTNNYRPSCDDGGGCVTVNAAWPTNGMDPLWGWNYVAWHGGAPTNNLYKQAAGKQMNLYAYYVR